jgi:hypothetical protein
MQYAAVCTRPHMSTALLSILGSPQVHPMEANLQALKEVIRYLHGTIGLRLAFGGGGGADYNLQLTCVADADWANDNITSR